MSGLVGYGSSSDEDSESEAPAIDQPSAEIAAPKEEPSLDISLPDVYEAGQIRARGHVTAEAPMVGPTVPTNGMNEVGIEEQLPTPEPSYLSEQDTIRYLTKTTHPMTSIPPSPPGSPDPAANARFRRFLELKEKGIHFNEDLAKKVSFRNPTLLTTMMTRVGIEGDAQYANSLPPSVWSVTNFPPTAYKEELLKSQQETRAREEATKKSLSATGRRVIDFSSAGTSGTSSKNSTPGQQRKRQGFGRTTRESN